MEENTSIKWRALEYEYVKKSTEWFWAIWILTGGIIFVSVVFGSILFAILIFLSAFTLSLQAVRKPHLVDFEINSIGIFIDDKKYSYEGLTSYWINQEENKIILKSKNNFTPFITIPLDNTDVQKVDGFLIDYLEKKEHNEPLPHKITKYL